MMTPTLRPAEYSGMKNLTAADIIHPLVLPGYHAMLLNDKFSCHLLLRIDSSVTCSEDNLAYIPTTYS